MKKKGRDRHQAGSGKVLIEASGVAEYLSIIGATKLDPVKYEIFEQAEQTDVSRLLKIENAKLR